MPVDLPSFLRRSLLPVLFLFIGLLFASNVVLLMTRPSSGGPTSVTGSQSSVSNVYPAVAFGAVTRPFQPAAKFHQQAVPGVYVYAVGKEALPAVPPQMELYRDQGIVLDNDVFGRLLRSVGVTGDESLQMLPVSVGFETSDGARTLSVDIVKRELVVQVKPTGVSEPAVPPPADADVLAAGTAFAEVLGMKPASYDAPTVARGSGAAATSRLPTGMAEVRWPLKVGAYPVLDQYGKPVVGMSVTVNLKSGRATQLSVRLLSPSVLAASAYPTVSPEALLAAVSGGGLTPIRSTTGKPAVTLPLKNLTLVYVLWEGDGELPSYLIPAVTFGAEVPLGCKDCQPWQWASYVPALDPAQFSWFVPPSSQSSAQAVSSAAASVAVKSSSAAKASSSAPVKPAVPPAGAPVGGPGVPAPN